MSAVGWMLEIIGLQKPCTDEAVAAQVKLKNATEDALKAVAEAREALERIRKKRMNAEADDVMRGRRNGTAEGM